ncbi:hypothetical protein ACWDE9_42495 [Streptomyces olivaceoviridis]
MSDASVRSRRRRLPGALMLLRKNWTGEFRNNAPSGHATGGPGTVDDPVADAPAAGYPDMTVRRIHDWIAKGLPDQPRLRTRPRGSDRAGCVHG